MYFIFSLKKPSKQWDTRIYNTCLKKSLQNETQTRKK